MIVVVADRLFDEVAEDVTRQFPSNSTGGCTGGILHDFLLGGGLRLCLFAGYLIADPCTEESCKCRG